MKLTPAKHYDNLYNPSTEQTQRQKDYDEFSTIALKITSNLTSFEHIETSLKAVAKL